MGITKVFVSKNKLRLVGDSRDVTVAYSLRQSVWDWCTENNITVEYQGTLGDTDLWRVRDEQQRAWFNLKWSSLQ